MDFSWKSHAADALVESWLVVKNVQPLCTATAKGWKIGEHYSTLSVGIVLWPLKA